MIAQHSLPAATPEPPGAFDVLARLLSVVHRHRRRAGLFFVAVMVLVGGWLVVVPRSYESQAKLFVRVGRESVTLDPTATTGQVIPVYDSREVEINSVLDLLASRRILERVVEDVGAQVVLTDRGLPSGGVPAAGNAPAHPALIEQAIRRLEKQFTTEHTKKSTVITLSCRAGSPELSQRLLDSFLAAFHTQYAEAHRTSGSYQFFVEQEGLLKRRLVDATGQLSGAKNDLGVVSIEDQRKTLQEQMTALAAERRTAETSLATSEATVAELSRQLESLPEQIAFQEVSGFPNGAEGLTQRQFYELQIRERELREKYTEHHPLVRAVREQIDQARAILDSDAPTVTQRTQAANPARQQVLLTLLGERSQAASLRAKVAALAEQHLAQVERLRALNDGEGRIAQLEQEVSLLKASHASYAEKLEQARIDKRLAEERISNVNIVQPPTFVAKPVFPRFRLMAALGLIVALLGAVGVAFACEHLPRALQRPEGFRPEGGTIRQARTTVRDAEPVVGRNS
ncbi:MAG: hypothetical protein KY476_11060 [Planctomycetes bacterium]|nr:hypothetical protein [Planctomycetota bacterium]